MTTDSNAARRVTPTTDRASHHERWGVRVKLNTTVTIRWNDRERRGTIRSISMSGCLVDTPFEFQDGMRAGLSFTLDNQTPAITIEATVVGRCEVGVGFRFLYRDLDTARVLKRWVDARVTPR